MECNGQLKICFLHLVYVFLQKIEMHSHNKIFMVELAEAVEEMKQIQEDKIQARSAEDFLDEL